MEEYNFCYFNIRNVHLYDLYDESTNAQLNNNYLYCSLLHWFFITDHPEFKEQSNQMTTGKKYFHTNTRIEIYHIYVS